jgi:phosphoglycolate phosphatase-like HAD superfamily hydrolase
MEEWLDRKRKEDETDENTNANPVSMSGGLGGVPEWNEYDRNTYIFDLDGTLADIKHRRHFVENGKKDWDAFFKACVDDKPNYPIIKICRGLRFAGFKVLIVSGRNESVRRQTEQWLQKYLIKYEGLIMRPEKDYTPDCELKLRWLNERLPKKHIIAVFDDRKRVVDMWRKQGYTCVQVAEGDF